MPDAKTSKDIQEFKIIIKANGCISESLIAFRRAQRIDSTGLIITKTKNGI